MKDNACYFADYNGTLESDRKSFGLEYGVGIKIIGMMLLVITMVD